MQCCSLQHWTLLLSPVTSTAGYCFCFGSIPSFFLELFLHWSPVAYWAPTGLESSSFSVLSFSLFILFMGVLKARILKRFAISFSSVPHFVNCPIGCGKKTETKVHRATVWRSLNSAGTTQIWKKLCQQPGHMVSWVNLWLAGIETIEFPFNIYRTENSLPSKFYIVFLNPFLLFSLILRRKKKKAVFPRRVTLGTRIFICSSYYSL